MMVERYQNLKEKVGGSKPRCEISSLLDRNLPGGQLPLVHWRWPTGPLSPKLLNKQEKKKDELQPVISQTPPVHL